MVLAVAAGVSALTGCSAGDAPAGQAGASSREGAAERAYRPPPATAMVERLATGGVRLGGVADPGALIRLATPRGAVLTTVADPAGGWVLFAPSAAEPRLFGLSMTQSDRTIRAEGYLVLTPQATAAQLRAGAGAWVLNPTAASARIEAVDFDRKGGAVISGRGAPREHLGLSIDGALRGRFVAGPDGRFSLPLDEPLAPGARRLEITGAHGGSGLVVAISPAAPLDKSAFRATPTPSGWRIDWLPPGGGVQTTVLASQSETPA